MENISKFMIESGNGGNAPSVDAWLKEAKTDRSASDCGMYLIHNGVVRQTARAKVRLGEETAKPVTGLLFSYDEEKAAAAVEETYQMPGIYYIRVWLNRGELSVGDDIMQVLIGGDIRPHVVDALQALVGQIKTKCVAETELF
ncbi:molybdenum cofactor biosynthesis protein MoaE [Ruminococcus sp. OA3]|uniref:molybdenum cofactor biosynthesis protein MoaE n=1 Tax=Ruminococcus sp. OA3 TaxID=2914164 RepID=UPI001F05B066|nr:molybdenum cofactor biosynthesis protein MoaE [Ruminococcus sp. OA3]MCH1983825.1 molybdenum cofactor biosynthesis protein MoaE [Ruminococcus sp. OA3]